MSVVNMISQVAEPGPEVGRAFAQAAMCRARGTFGEAVALHDDLMRTGRPDLEQRCRVELARDFKSAGLIDRAISQLTEALEICPGDLSALEELEDVYIQLRDWTTAIQIRQRMPRDSQSSRVLAHEWAALGRQHAKAGDTDSARFAFETSVRTSPEVADAYVGLGDVLEGQGRIQAAGRLWVRALHLRGDLGTVLYPRLSPVLEPLRLVRLLSARSQGNDSLARLWLALVYLDQLPVDKRGDSMAIWAQIDRIPGGLPLAAEFARDCEDKSGAVFEVIRTRLQFEIESARMTCQCCGATAMESPWLCPHCVSWAP